MSSPSGPDKGKAKGKGKGKAIDLSPSDGTNERAPLLGGSSSSRVTNPGQGYAAIDGVAGLDASDCPEVVTGNLRRRRSRRTVGDGTTPDIRISWTDRLLLPAIIICSVLLALCLFILRLAYSFVPSESERAFLTSSFTSPTGEDRSSSPIFTLAGPDKVHVVNLTDDGIWLDFGGSYRIDTDLILGIRRSHSAPTLRGVEAQWDTQEWRGMGSTWWEGLRDRIGDRLIGLVDAVDVWIPGEVEVNPSNIDADRKGSSRLMTATIPSPLQIELLPSNPEPKTDARPLRPISTLIHIRPNSNMSTLMSYARHTWQAGLVEVEVRVPVVRVGPAGADRGRSDGKGKGGGQGIVWGPFGWKRLLTVERNDVVLPVRFQLSRFPSLPSPKTNLSDLISLRSYSLSTRSKPVSSNDSSTVLGIIANATAANIVPDCKFDLPYRLGFEIGLPASRDSASTGEDDAPGRIRRDVIESFKMAEVGTYPIELRGQDPVVVSLEGEIVGDLNDGLASVENDNRTVTPLSAFLRNYLRGIDNLVVVTGSREVTETLTRNEIGNEDSPTPPEWLLAALPHVSLEVPFPSPRDSPELIRSVTIEDMRISQSSGKMVASGTVLAEIQLPKDFIGVNVQVKGVRPDVLVYDGPATDGWDGEEVPEAPPYPPRAFGRIHPDYLDSTSVRSETEPEILIVRAPLKDVPLEVLSGRDAVLSDFVGKVIFKGGAIAGVRGLAGVRVHVEGVRGMMKLERLSVHGEVKVGKPR